MARPLSRASQAKLDALHGLVAQTLVQQIRKAHKAEEPVSAAVLSTAISLLKLTDTTSARAARKKDRLAGLLAREKEHAAKDAAVPEAAGNRPMNPLADFGDIDAPRSNDGESIHDLRRTRRNDEQDEADDDDFA